jgi:4-hydroxyacetophenone monooxygenase
MSPLLHHLEIETIKDDDTAIAAALADVSVPALMASVVQITGDLSYVRGPIRPREFVMNEFQGKLREEEKDELRRAALNVICAWRDAGCPPPKPPGKELIREIMDWIACEGVPDDYAQMYMEELDLAGENPRAIAQTSTDEGLPEPDFLVLVIGCGEAGLLAGIRLKEAGIPFEIIEKNDDVGGTWLENTYPGARVDVASHYYSYSFGRNDEFSEYYAQQPELYRYFSGLLEEHGIAEHVRWRSEVERAVWDESSAQWHVTFRGPDDRVETRSANVVISGVGILNRPLIPELPNLEKFRGPVFHSAQWDHSVDLHGKRVALVGAGASGFQIAPAIAGKVDELIVFQRTPQWMAPNPRYHASVKSGERWALRHLPGYGRWFRFMLMWQSSDKLLELVRIDHEWADFPRTANAFSAQRREVFVKWIEQNVGDDPALLAKIMPHYPPMSKRMLQDNGSWLKCLKQPNVELVNKPIVDISESSLATADGQYDVDVIILATGFRASEVLYPLAIVGRDGLSIAEVWDGKPSAYRGISVPGFPNFFILGGPGTGLAHAGSVIFTTESQMRYIGDALRTLLKGRHRSIEPTLSAYDRYKEDLQAEVETLMWGHPSIEHSWYKSPDGKVYLLCPWRLVDYWKMTEAVELHDHVVRYHTWLDGAVPGIKVSRQKGPA